MPTKVRGKKARTSKNVRPNFLRKIPFGFSRSVLSRVCGRCAFSENDERFPKSFWQKPFSLKGFLMKKEGGRNKRLGNHFNRYPNPSRKVKILKLINRFTVCLSNIDEPFMNPYFILISCCLLTKVERFTVNFRILREAVLDQRSTLLFVLLFLRWFRRLIDHCMIERL